MSRRVDIFSTELITDGIYYLYQKCMMGQVELLEIKQELLEE
jgi:hypothetical protein